jgi:hypothetical protein
VTTPLTRPVESDPELAGLERKWTAISSVVLAVAFCGFVLLLAVSATQAIGGVRRLDLWPPFDHEYNAAFDSLLVYWWAVGLPVIAILGAALLWLFGAPRALIVLGAAGVLLALLLALRPIASYPATKQTPGRGDCAAVLGSGPYGDGDETCFDVRRVRRSDASTIALSGGLMIAAGGALRANRRRRARRTDAHRASH